MQKEYRKIQSFPRMGLFWAVVISIRLDSLHIQIGTFRPFRTKPAVYSTPTPFATILPETAYRTRTDLSRPSHCQGHFGEPPPQSPGHEDPGVARPVLCHRLPLSSVSYQSDARFVRMKRASFVGRIVVLVCGWRVSISRGREEWLRRHRRASFE
jgi:hypothetical protein